MDVEPDRGPALREGVLVGKRFRLERPLGHGASGSVWLATHLALSSSVAIKFLDRSTLMDADEMDRRLDRFRFEAQVSARLASRTTCTVAVHDAGLFQGIPYLVMEYAPGLTLDDMVTERGGLEPRLVAQALTQVAEALESAHALGIIHRDVKLANILSLKRDDGRDVFKLCDFGVARIAGERDIGLSGPKKTTAGLIVGTPAYMSPEQIGGTGEYGSSVDHWALGVVAYEALTGQLPFNSPSVNELAVEISARPHPAPSKIRPELRRFDGFFEKALAKAPEDRFESAGELARAFSRCVDDTGEQLVSLEAPVVRRRVTWVPVVALGAALALLLVAALSFTHRSTAAEPASAQRVDASDGAARSVASPGITPASLATVTADTVASTSATAAPVTTSGASRLPPSRSSARAAATPSGPTPIAASVPPPTPPAPPPVSLPPRQFDQSAVH